MTVAHIALGTKPHENWALWSRALHVALPGYASFSISLFGKHAERFRHLPYAGSLKPDVICVPLAEAEWQRLVSHCRAFTQLDIGLPATGRAVSGHGYPGYDPWPGAIQMFKAAAEAHPLRVRFNHAMVEGYSGGPLIDDTGRLIGILDSTDDQQRGYAWEMNFVRNIVRL